MNEIFYVQEKPANDESIIKKEFHSYYPYQQNFKANDEVRISLQNQDLYVLPCESFLHFEGTLSKIIDSNTGTTSTNGLSGLLKNNCMAYFLDEIRYELNGCCSAGGNLLGSVG